jgi:polyisoprenoid-binding protein YceI
VRFRGHGQKPQHSDEETLVKNWIALPLMMTVVLMGISGCANPADDVAPASVSEPKPVSPAPDAPSRPGTAVAPLEKGSQLASPASSGAPVITPENTTIEFIGSKVTGSHHGGFKTFKGTFEVVPGKIETSRITAEIDANSIWADNGRVTNHLKSPDFFDVAKFPTATFVSSGIESGSRDPKAKDATHMVTGNLTLHGITKSITFPVKIVVAGGTATLDSEFFINRKDFGIVYPGQANDLIRDEVVIKLAVRTPVSTNQPAAAAVK